MVANGGLWFAKAATYHDDPWEGFCKAEYRAIPSADPRRWLDAIQSGQAPTVISVDQMSAHLNWIATECCEKARDHLYVSSWSLARDSLAMWEIYASQGRGVAIQSSIGQFQRAARFNVRPEQYACRKVEYHDDVESSPATKRDFTRGAIPLSSNLWHEVLELSFHKRCAYRYEEEWRASVYQDARPDIAGIHVAFDLDQLIGTVYVGPRAEDFLIEAVKTIMDRFSLRRPLERSTLLIAPPAPVG